MSLLIQPISFSKEFVAHFKDKKFGVNSNIIYKLRDRNVLLIVFGTFSNIRSIENV